jgi:hypothetical protein
MVSGSTEFIAAIQTHARAQTIFRLLSELAALGRRP